MIVVRRMAVAAVCWMMVADSAYAQTQLNGRVVDDLGKPVVGVTVTLTSIGYSVKTDSLGRFQLSGTPGSTLNLTLKAAGFRDDTASVVLSRGRPVTRDFTMVSEATALPEANPSDRVLRGRITTTENEPIAYANFQINGGRRYVTDDSGKFEVPFNTSSAKIIVRRIGFEPTEVNLPVMPDTAIRVRMTAVARTLETQVITVRSPFVRLDLNGFYARMTEVERGARVGYFVTPEDLAMRNPQNVTDAVEQFPSIRLRPIGGGIPLNRKMRIEDRNGCPFTVYLDKVRIQPSMVSLKPVDEEVNTLVQPHAVAGIEVYPRKVGAPPGYPPFEGGGICQAGVVLIWTK